MPEKEYPVTGVGIGLRRDLMTEVEAHRAPGIDFMEVAPENWINVGGFSRQTIQGIDRALPIHYPRSVPVAGQPCPTGRRPPAVDQAISGRARRSAATASTSVTAPMTATSTI